MRVIMVPGIGGSDADHWQSRWEALLPEVTRIQPASWDEPDRDDWSAALDDAAVGDAQAVIVAHSLGCLLAARWAEAHPERLSGVFFVAPPDRTSPAFPAAAATFDGGVASPLAVPSIVVASADDPYCSPSESARLAAMWGAEHVNSGDNGHLNSASGLGEWRQGFDLFTAFTAKLRGGAG